MLGHITRAHTHCSALLCFESCILLHNSDSILIQVRTLCIFLKPFRGGLAGVFWITVLLQNPSALQQQMDRHSPSGFFSRLHNSGFHSPQQASDVLKQHVTATDHRTTTTNTTILYWWYDVTFLNCCIIYRAVFVSSPLGIFPKVLEITLGVDVGSFDLFDE